MDSETILLTGIMVVAVIITLLSLVATQQCAERSTQVEHMKSFVELYNNSKRPYKRMENMTMFDGVRTTVADKLDDFSDKLDGYSEKIRPEKKA